MINKESIIGQNIICSREGIGEIIDVIALQDGGENFYKVNFPQDKCINYLSVKNKSNYRVLSSKETLNKAIEEFKSKFQEPEYKSTQEKINKQKEMLKEDNIIKLAKTLSLLNNEKDLHVQISKPFRDTLDSFIDEIGFVFNVSRTEATLMLNIKSSSKKLNK